MDEDHIVSKPFYFPSYIILLVKQFLLFPFSLLKSRTRLDKQTLGCLLKLFYIIQNRTYVHKFLSIYINIPFNTFMIWFKLG